MRKLIKHLSLVLAFIISSLAYGQNVSLDQCIMWGQERNPSLIRTSLDLRLNNPAAMAAYGQFLPSVSVHYGISQHSSRISTYVADDGRVIELPVLVSEQEIIPIQERKSRNSGYYLNVDEVFFDGGRNYYNLKNSKLAKEIRDNNITVESLDLRTAITRSYCQVVASQQRQELANQVVRQRAGQLELAQVRFETGSVTRRDVLQAEVDFGRALNDSIASKLDLSRSMQNLNLLTGLPLDTVFTIENLPPLFLPDWNVKELTNQAFNLRSDLRNSDLNTQIYKNNHRAATGDYLPSLVGSYSYSRSEQSGTNVSFTLDPRNRSQSYNLTLSWTLFDRFTRSLRLQEAKVNYQKSLISIEEFKREIQQRVFAAYDRLGTVYNQYQVASKNADLATETLRFEEERYRLGSATTLDIGAAQVSFIQAKNDQIQLETEFYISLGELEQATGLILRDRK